MLFQDEGPEGLALSLGNNYSRKQEDESLRTKQSKTSASTGFHRPFPSPDLSLRLLVNNIPTRGEETEVNPVLDREKIVMYEREDAVLLTRSLSPGVYPSTVIKRERDVVMENLEITETLFSRVSDEEEEGSGRKKLRLTKEQSSLLEESFKQHSTLNPKQKQALAKQLNLRLRQVEVWFQNRRARTKLKQTEVDCELLKRCCETLSDENRRLHKELEELKAMKFAPPLYIQLPPADTPIMCSSCQRRVAAVTKDHSGSGTNKNHFNKNDPFMDHPFSSHPSTAC